MSGNIRLIAATENLRNVANTEADHPAAAEAKSRQSGIALDERSAMPQDPATGSTFQVGAAACLRIWK